LLDIGERDGAGVDLLADALYTRIEEELAPATDRLTPAQRHRLQALLRQLADPGQ
jgi:hypothetical protein